MTGAIIGAGVLGAGASIYSANRAAGASRQAASATVAGQTEQLNYLKEVNRLPQQYKEEALKKLGSVYGLPGGDAGTPLPGGMTNPFTDRAGFISGLKDDPFYEQLRSTGERAVLSGAAATGGLRSGNTSESLARNNQDVLAGLYNQRMGEFQNYTSGLSGIAGMPTGVATIGGVMGNIGATKGQGIIGAAQASQRGFENATNIGLSTIGTLIDKKLI